MKRKEFWQEEEKDGLKRKTPAWMCNRDRDCFPNLHGGEAGVNWKWYNAGIKWLSDIVNEEEGRMLTLSEIESKYDIAIPFTEYLGLQTSIPDNGGLPSGLRTKMKKMRTISG